MKRRTFIQTSSLASGSILLGTNTIAAENKIKIGIVGTGWFGSDVHLVLMHLSNQFDIVGICDVNQVSIDKALANCQKNQIPLPKIFRNYKELYEMPGLQAVSIATPTYWHSLQFVDACKKGLHVLLEKPVCFDIAEGLAMVKAQKETGNVVAVDFKSLNSTSFAVVKDYIKNGEAGKIKQVIGNLFFNDGDVSEHPIPSTIDFDAFCGPAPIQKYMLSQGAELPSWKFSKAMNHGPAFDWGLHYFNNARRILDLTLPEKVSAIGGKNQFNGIETPDFLLQNFQFGDLNVQFSTRTFGSAGPSADNNIGTYFYGEKATVFAGEVGWEIYPADGSAKIPHGKVSFDGGDPVFLEKMNANLLKIITNFAEGVRANSNKNIVSPLEDSFQATAAMILADIAFKTKSELNIDTKKLDIIGNETARKLLKRAYRKPYKHPSEIV